jgi:hypothetical protein
MTLRFEEAKAESNFYIKEKIRAINSVWNQSLSLQKLQSTHRRSAFWESTINRFPCCCARLSCWMCAFCTGSLAPQEYAGKSQSFFFSFFFCWPLSSVLLLHYSCVWLWWRREPQLFDPVTIVVRRRRRLGLLQSFLVAACSSSSSPSPSLLFWSLAVSLLHQRMNRGRQELPTVQDKGLSLEAAFGDFWRNCPKQLLFFFWLYKRKEN